MDFPRNLTELRRAAVKLWVLRFTLAAALALTLLAAGWVLRNRNSSEPAPEVYLPPPLPDSVWTSRIYEWAESSNPLSCLIISHEDTIITEHYFHDMLPNMQINVKSVSKSILSTLVGVALEEGYLDSLDQKVADLLPTYFNEHTDPRKSEITLRHLITMTAGLEGTSFDNYDPWILSSDWIRHVLQKPLLAEPGSRRIYSTGNTHLLSVILTEATGMSTLSFGRRYLFEPLGIRMRAWDRDPKGYYLGGNNMHLTPREMLAFGQLYLHNGRIGDKQIVSERWIRESLTPFIRSRFGSSGYGYCWWYRRMAGEDVYYAVGYGGQYIAVVPELELTVVLTSSLNTGQRRPTLSSLMSSRVIPAIRDRIRNREAASDSLQAVLNDQSVPPG